MTSISFFASTVSRITTIAVAAAALSLGCADASDPSADALGAGTYAVSLQGFTAKQFAKQVELIGEDFYGASTPAIPFQQGGKKFKGFSFVGQGGDQISLHVYPIEQGDAVAYVLNDKYKVIAADESCGSTDARIDFTLPGATSGHPVPRTFYFVYRDRHNQVGAAFATDLQGPCGDVTGLCEPGQVVDPATCACVAEPTPPPAPTPVVVDPALLAGAWKMTAMIDSGNQPQPVGDGPVYTFGVGGSLSLDCSGSPSGTWALDASHTVIEVTLGGGSVSLQWVALQLDAEHLALYEGGDVFLFEHGTCP